MTETQLNEFLNSKNYDIRLTHNARWIDQKCTPDVTWSIADFVLNYIDNVKETFTVKDIWTSEYAKLTIAETYSKPDTDEATAESEYDKVFSQPLAMFCYAGIIEDICQTSRHLYRVINRPVIEYIARNDVFALRFLYSYIEKVLSDSGLINLFNSFFENQDKISFQLLKDGFIDFYHNNTPVKKDYEPKRIFTKVINPLAFKYGKKGSEDGRMSHNKITKSDMMYNRDNFRDVYSDKPKEISRQEWLRSHPEIDVRKGYFEQMMSCSKRLLKEYISENRNNISELTQFIDGYSDKEPATQIHHIFPKNEFPEIMHYLENLIALTPNQHFCFAHPNNNTQIIDVAAQKILLIAKTCSIKDNITNENEETIFSFVNLLKVLSIGWDDMSVLEIEDNNYNEILYTITYHYNN